MGALAIRAQGLGKCYHVYEKPHHRLMQFVAGRRRSFYREVWALRDVSLELHRGACFGIVGRNGAGKTTLLQMISGVLTPTEGEVEVFGRLTALLELGSGFHRDFTGRENVFMAGALLGLSKREIQDKFDHIAGFADIGEFMDRAVRTYSKGMYARLAFAVYASLDPDIFIVDEALAVGDAAFRHRCMYRFREMRDRGVTMLYVSHDAGSMKQFCDEVLWIDGGVLRQRGEAAAVTRVYLNDLFGVAEQPSADGVLKQGLPMGAGLKGKEEQVASVDAKVRAVSEAEAVDEAEATAASVSEHTVLSFQSEETRIPGGDGRTGDKRAVIEGVELYDTDARPCRAFGNGDVMVLRVTCRNVSLDPSADRWVLGYTLRNFKGQDIAGFNTAIDDEPDAPPPIGASRTQRFEITLPVLHSGDYALTVAVAGWGPDETHPTRADRIENAVVFRLATDRRVHNILYLDTAFIRESSSVPLAEQADSGRGSSMSGV